MARLLRLLAAFSIAAAVCCAASLSAWAQKEGQPAGPEGWSDEQPVNPPGASDIEEGATDNPPLAEVDPESLLNLVAPGLSVDKLLDVAPPTAGDKDSEALLKEILARPEFNSTKQADRENWFDRFTAWLQRLFSRFNPQAPAWLGWLGGRAGVVITCSLLLLLAYVIARLVWTIVSRRRMRLEASEGAEQLPSRPEELLAQARTAAERGDYRSALRLRFRAVIARLDLPSSSLLTNSQLARQLRREAPDAASPFAELSGCFEDVWYGGQNCQEPLYRKADALAQRIEAALAAALSEAAEAQ